MKPLEHCSLTCIYCDDIRDEVAGKTSLIGWYPVEPVRIKEDGTLLLPTLCALGLLSIPLSLEFSTLKVELIQDDSTIETIDLPQTRLEEIRREGIQSPGPLQAIQMRIAIKMVNLQVSQPTTLHMRVSIDDFILDSNTLRFVR